MLRVVRKTLKLEDADDHPDRPRGQYRDAAARGAHRSRTSTWPRSSPGRRRRAAGATWSSPSRRSTLTAGANAAARRHNLRFGTLAVLLTRDVGGLGPSWGYFIIAGGAALLIAALVAWQMSRRMARPLVEAMEVTGRIASGELESRVPVRPNDYPEFASLAGSINDMAQSLEDGRARERHLLLAVSHDLRTPLTSIRGFAEAIQDGAIEDSGQAADVIIAESRRLERLVG